MTKMKPCPKCESGDIATERSPNGSSWCRACGFQKLNKDWPKEILPKSKSEITSYLIHLDDEIAKVGSELTSDNRPQGDEQESLEHKVKAAVDRLGYELHKIQQMVKAHG